MPSAAGRGALPGQPHRLQHAGQAATAGVGQEVCATAPACRSDHRRILHRQRTARHGCRRPGHLRTRPPLRASRARVLRRALNRRPVKPAGALAIGCGPRIPRTAERSEWAHMSLTIGGGGPPPAWRVGRGATGLGGVLSPGAPAPDCGRGHRGAGRVRSRGDGGARTSMEDERWGGPRTQVPPRVRARVIALTRMCSHERAR